MANSFIDCRVTIATRNCFTNMKIDLPSCNALLCEYRFLLSVSFVSVSHQPYGLYAISNLRKPRVLRRFCSLKGYCTVSSLLSKITCIYKRNRLLKTPSKHSNHNCNYRPLKFMQIRFLSPAHLFFLQLFLHNLILISVIIP